MTCTDQHAEMPVPIDLISIIFPHQLIQIRDNDTDPCPGQSRLAANIRKLVYKNISSLTRRANLPACAQKQRRAHGLQTQCGEKCPRLPAPQCPISA